MSNLSDELFAKPRKSKSKIQIRISVAAERMLDMLCAINGGLTRSAVIEMAIRRRYMDEDSSKMRELYKEQEACRVKKQRYRQRQP